MNGLAPDDRLALLMEGHLLDERANKMGRGLLRYAQSPVAAVIDSGNAGVSLSEAYRFPVAAPVVASLDEAVRLGATALVTAISPTGGRVPESWLPILDRAIDLGLKLVNALHTPLAGRYPGRPVWDVRQEPDGLIVADGRARTLSNRRCLFVGTDMAIGKMTAALETHRSALGKGVNASFVATGQLGMIISGGGVPLDSIRVDYAAGAIEREVLAGAEADLVLIEGQGSLLHPGSTSNLALLRGALPTHLVLCHRAGMQRLSKATDVLVPPLIDVIQLFEDVAGAAGAFARPTTVAVSLNCGDRSDAEAERSIAETEAETGLPTVDPFRGGADRIVDALMA